jgi:HAD superfamily hydrolase (TIGR01509 family)
VSIASPSKPRSSGADPTRTPEALLFDMDGVLVDSYEAWFHLVRDATVRHGFAEATRERFAETWGQGVDADAASFFPGMTADQVEHIYHDSFADYLEHVAVEPGASDTLAALRGLGIKTAVVTNTPRDLAHATLARAAVRPDRLVTCSDVEQAKPAPDMVLLALERLGVGTEAAWFVGDSRFDEQAASAAGVRFVGFRREAPLRIETLDALLRLVS